MTIKIKAPRAYYYDVENECHMAIKGGTHRVVSESDWKRLMKLVRGVEICEESGDDTVIWKALDALRGKK